MARSNTPSYWEAAVRELCAEPAETTWLEFKRNAVNHERLGQNLSALSNSAALEGRDTGYLIWGVDDETREICGTDFVPKTTKHGNEELEAWLARLLAPRINFHFHTVFIGSHRVVVLEIPAATNTPTRFGKESWIRIGSNTKPLLDYPQREKELWRTFDRTPFEKGIAAGDVSDEDVLSLLDYAKYFSMLSLPIPESHLSILDRLEKNKLITRNTARRWKIPNLSAILLAKNIQTFPTVSRKALRVILYDGDNRIRTISEQVGKLGYAVGFEKTINYIQSLIPGNEVIKKALREQVPMYPIEAIRELVANALIHQDFSITGAGPMVEIFSDRIEISNPGSPLIETQRFIDSNPQSRNEDVASLMKILKICEERGSGIDKVVFQTEFYQLPAPIFSSPGNSTKAVLFSHKDFKDMDTKDRVRACYLHACLRCVSQKEMNNTSLRERFGIHHSNSAMISRVIKDTLSENLIKPYSRDQAKRNARYLPFWA